MKPVVSSLVALAIAIAPLSVMAKPAHSTKSAHAKVVKTKADQHVSKADKEEKGEKVAEKDDDKSAIVRVKAGKKERPLLKNVVHHAHNVDLGGAGHKEPKADHGVLVAASLKTSAPHAAAKSNKAAEMPELPNAKAGKPSKGGAEKGARKATKKSADASDDGSGEPTRDEEFAELVARIRGHHASSSDSDGALHDEGAKAAPKGDAKDGKPANADAKDAKGPTQVARRVSHRTPVAPCAKDPVEIVRGPEIERFALTKCDGSVAPLAVEHLSVLVRPGGAARPTASITELAKKPGTEIAHGIRRVDPRLVERIQAVVDRFGKSGEPAKLFVISGYRPASVGSMHSTGRAIDFRVEGAKNEDVVSFCKTLADTGCGFYPNSSFVHIDVRDTGAGHVSWIDASGPGETPRYVTQWPPPGDRILKTASVKTTEELAAEGESILRAQRPLEHEAESADDHAADTRSDD